MQRSSTASTGYYSREIVSSEANWIGWAAKNWRFSGMESRQGLNERAEL
jgi:hypothetical protein